EGRPPLSAGRYDHAGTSLPTFRVLIWDRGEKRVPARSWLYIGQPAPSSRGPTACGYSRERTVPVTSRSLTMKNIARILRMLNNADHSTPIHGAVMGDQPVQSTTSRFHGPERGPASVGKPYATYRVTPGEGSGPQARFEGHG